MRKRYILGIDIGTSGCKSIIVDEKGKVAGSTVVEYPLCAPKLGWAEQNPLDWWDACKTSVKKVLRQSHIPATYLTGLGLSGQMHGLVVLDKYYSVLRPAILWNDQRTSKQCETITEAVGGESKLLELINNKMLPGYTAGKILWLRENEPSIYDRARIFLNPKDYVRFMLTDEFATEVSDASGTGLFDVKHRKWNEKILSVLDIPKSKLPECFESEEVTGRVTKKNALEMGLPEGLPVVGGGGDAVIQSTGTGLIKQGIVGTIIGTAGIVAMGLEGYHLNRDGNLQIFCSNTSSTWHAMGVTLAAGGSYRWYRDTLCENQKREAIEIGTSVYDILENLASTSPPGSKNLLYLPYLAGERCPYADPVARGAFIGLTLQHTRADITRAVMEGVVFSLRQVMELITSMDEVVRVDEIRTSGGGSLSQTWRQIQADIFQVPIKTFSGSAEGGAYGAALIAGVGCGIWNSVQDAIKLLEIETEDIPNVNNKHIYDELYGIYKDLYPTLKNVNNQLSKIK